jgi:hypothetical protein
VMAKITVTIECDPDNEPRAAIMVRFRNALLAETKRAKAERIRNERIRRHIESPEYQRNRAICEAFRNGGVSYTDLGREHGITGQRVKQIIDGKYMFDKFMSEDT